MALDLDNGTWEMFIDGFPTTTIYSGISGTYIAVGDTMSSIHTYSKLWTKTLQVPTT